MKINFKKLFAPAALIGMLLFSTAAMAQSPYYRGNNYPGSYNNPYDNYRAAYYTQKRTIGERLQNQKRRISEGQRDGSLTKREADNLWRQHYSLERELASTSRNGYMTPQQYNHFQFELDQISKVIFNAKHNRRDQYNNGWRNNGYGYRR